MSEILGAVRLKERILIIVLTLALALFVGGAAGAITYATTDRHVHEYEFHLDRGEDGEFDFIGVCSVEDCPDPTYVRNITDPETYVTSKVVTEATCYSEGKREYSFTSAEDLKTYTFSETIPMLSHTLEGSADIDGSSIDVKCTAEGCEHSVATSEGVTELELTKTVPATCHSPREDHFSCKVNGEVISFVSYTEEDVEHKLGGLYVSEYLLTDGVYLYGTPGMTAINNNFKCGKTSSGYYSCEECKKTIPITLGKPDHVFEYVAEESVMPTMRANGYATVKCTNDGCTDSKRVELPMAVEGKNAFESGKDHVLEERYLAYSYVSVEYGFTVNVDFTLTWVDHTYAFTGEGVVDPTVDSTGLAIVTCTHEGCDKFQNVTIPKIRPGVNTVVVSEATELKRQVIRYTFVNEEYDFSIDFDMEYGELLTHNYVYGLEPYRSKFVVVGRCNQPDCQAKVIYDTDTPVTEQSFPATCMEYAKVVYTAVKNGVTYTEVMEFKYDGYGDHSFAYSEADTVLPTLESDGTAIIKCVNNGCEEHTEAILPKIVIGENAVSVIDEERGLEVVTYTYSFEIDGSTYNVETVFEKVLEHDHVYEYELKPADGLDFKFDLVGTCTYPSCTEEIREESVDAVLIDDTSTCTTTGQQTWEYVKDGQPYHCYILIEFVVGHSLIFDPEADTTVNPNFVSGGSVEIYCRTCGEYCGTVQLPAMVLGENTTILDDTKYQIVYRYSYVGDCNGEEVPINLFITHIKN